MLRSLGGTWLMGVAHPLHPEAHGLVTMLYALGAALLWGLGTVFGRYLAREMRFEHVTTLRFVFGLPASGIALLVLGSPAFASLHDTYWIAVLALVTGFAAMFLYYYGLRSTPAVVATIAELAYGFQESVVDVLVTKTIRAAEETSARSIVLGGGVAANRVLRERLVGEAQARGLPCIVPPPALCTDNGAMIGAAGAWRLAAGDRAGLDLDARPSLPLATR